MGDPTLPSKHAASSVGPLPPATAEGHDEAVDAVLEARAAQQSLLVEVNAALAAALDVEDVLGQILTRLTERARLVSAAIFLYDEVSRQLRSVAQSGYPDAERSRTLPIDGSDLVACVARERQSVYVPDVTRDKRAFGIDPRARSEFAVPLVAGPTLLGVLDIASDRPDGIRAVTRTLIDQFAGQAALAIERNELYKRLRSSERRFRSLFEQSHVGVALYDLQGRFLEVNSALTRILGYEPSELTCMFYLEVSHPEDREASVTQVEQLLEGKLDRCVLENRYLRKSGESVWCSTILSLIRDASGRAAYVLAMVLDISEHKKAEGERARLQEQLFHAQKMKALGTLAGGIAHDFNNLLGVISGYASLLRLRLPGQDPRQELVAMMQESTERASELTRQLLQFARQESPKLQPVDIGSVVGNVLKIISQTFDRRIQLEHDLPPDLPLVEGDSGQLELALLNLCINAGDAMPEGGRLTLAVAVVDLGPKDIPPDTPGAPGRYVRLVVRDTGKGMEPEIIRRIFEPFFTTKQAGKGWGLGLAMVYGIVTHHQGFIGVRSQVGQGTEFTVHLPVTDKPAEALPEETPAAERGQGTILVVDDEPLMLAFASDAVKELGYNALTAADGDQARALYRHEASRIDAVLLDMIMPGASWESTLQAFLAINPHARVVMTSGYNGPREARRAMEQGAVAFLGKPYTIESLAGVLKDAAALGRRQ